MNKTILIATALVFLYLPKVHSQEVDAQKQALIDELLVQTGQSATDVGMQMSNYFVQEIFKAMKQANPDLDPQALDIVEEEVDSVLQEELVEKKALEKIMHPIYARHFSADELQDIIAFNNTPTGAKAVKVMPQISQEGMQAGQQFGQSLQPIIGERVEERLKAEGIELDM